MGIRDKMWVAHSGDSRAYLVDKKAATAITTYASVSASQRPEASSQLFAT